MSLTNAQYEQLLKPLNGTRVAKRKQGGSTLSYLEAWDVKAHLTRIFGFGGWSAEVLEASLACEDKGERNYDVSYRVVLRLTIHGIRVDGGDAVFTEAAVGSAHLPQRGEAHDMAIKTAESDALKRAAINLGTQFGLSLYSNGSLRDVVGRTLSPAFHDETDVITEAPVSPADAPEAPEGAPVAETPVSPASDPETTAAWVARLKQAMSDGDVAGVVGIKSEMQAADVTELVHDGKTLGKLADMAVVHAGKVAAGRAAITENSTEVTA